MDILKDQWSPALTLKTALLSVQALLSAPEPNDPQDAVVAQQVLLAAVQSLNSLQIFQSVVWTLYNLIIVFARGCYSIIGTTRHLLALLVIGLRLLPRLPPLELKKRSELQSCYWHASRLCVFHMN